MRKYSVKQLVSAGVLLHNPDKPDRAVNSSDNCYQVENNALGLFKQYGSKTWEKSLQTYLATCGTLTEKYARERDLHRIPVQVKPGQKITISAGHHSNLIRCIIEDFGPNFVPGGELAAC